MTNTIDQNCQLNAFYRNIFNARPKQPSEITKSDLESYTPKESKGFDESITAVDLFQNSTEQDKKLFDDKWVAHVVSEPEDEETYAASLIKHNYSQEAAEAIIDYSIDNSERQKSWSKVNEETGKEASNL